MRVEHVIYLSSAGCMLWSWRDREFAAGRVQTPMGTDPGPVVAELCRLKAGPIAVLVDMVDEEHSRETVARLGRRDQQAVLERKLARAFPRTVFRTARIQGRNAANPDENHVLLSALTRPEPVRVLLQRLADARLPLAGVFSPALLTHRLLDAGARKAPAALLVLRRSDDRLQHSFFRGGELLGSRRLRAQSTPVLDDAGMALRLLEESLRYFDPTLAVTAETPLLVLLPPADRALLATTEPPGEGWHLRAFDDAELRRRLGIRAAAGCTTSERLFIELLRGATATPGFAPPQDRRHFEHYRVRRYGRVASVALAATAVAGTLLNVLHIADTRRQLASSGSTVQQLESLLPGDRDDGIVAVDPVEMQRMVSAYDAVLRRQADPEQILLAISTAVSQRPGIQLDAIRWSTSGPSDENSPDPSGAPDGVRITLSGHVAPFNGDFPRAFAEVDAFMEALRRVPAVGSVTAREQPLDVSPHSTLTGEVADGQPAGRAEFKLDVIMRTPDEQA